jgi:aldose 1-epimerase
MSEVPSGAQWTIRHGEHEATVVEVGGGLRTYRVGGADVLDGYGEQEICPSHAGHVLAPWPNRIRDGRYMFTGEEHQLPLSEPGRHSAIHGLVTWVRWRRVHNEPDQVTLEYDLPAQPGYPWPLLLRTEWTVDGHGVRAVHSATNRGRSACPFGLAAHPYLRIPGVAVDDVVLRVPARTRLLVDGRLLPIGAAKVAGGEFDFTEPRRIGGQVLDVAFGGLVPEPDGGTTVELSTMDSISGRSVGSGQSTVEEHSDRVVRGVRVWAGAGFHWWQVFTADTLAGPRRRRSVAVEPMTCPPDAFRSGRDVVVLEPGQTWSGAWGITPVVGTP